MIQKLNQTLTKYYPLFSFSSNFKQNQNQQTNPKSIKINYLYIVAAGALGLTISYYKEFNQQKLNSQSKPLVAQVGGAWQLIDTKGNEISDKTLKGSNYLIYFGFCNCPEICPTQLTKISKVVKNLRIRPEVQNIPLKTVFVSIDPDRDNNQKIEGFLGLFDDTIIGATGSNNNDKNLKDAMKSFKIYANKIEMDQLEDEQSKSKRQFKNSYTFDHSIITYLMDVNNNYLCHIGPNLSEEQIEQLILEKLQVK